MKEQPLNSYFLSGVSAPEQRDLSRVLVLGGDWIGLELSEQLARNGFEVVLLGTGPAERSLPGVTAMPSATLEELRGFVGDFTAILRTPGGPVHERIGSVVAAGPARLEAKHAQYGLCCSDRVLSLSDLEARFRRGDALGPRQGAWLHVAFLLGLKGESHPADFSRVLDALERVAALEQVQPYVFTRNLKVAGPGLERRYRESRERGTLYFKFDDDGPALSLEDGQTAVIFEDPLLGQEMVLYPDILVVDETMLPPASSEPLLKAIPSSPAFEPFSKPDSTRFLGVHTPKAGVFVVGPSRGVFAADMIRGDMLAVQVALKRALSVPDRTDWAAPQVDANRCTMCLTCVRLCPHGAMGFEERPGADPTSCVRCGICAAECPMAAITLTPPAQVEDVCGVGASIVAQSKVIAAFLCSRSAADAFAGINPGLKEDVTVIPVPCAGTVSVQHMLTALGNGASAVLVAGCYKGNCASIYGTTLAEQRSTQTRRLLEEAGVPSSRVCFVSCASNASGNLAAALHELHESVRAPKASAPG